MTAMRVATQRRRTGSARCAGVATGTGGRAYSTDRLPPAQHQWPRARWRMPLRGILRAHPTTAGARRCVNPTLREVRIALKRKPHGGLSDVFSFMCVS